MSDITKFKIEEQTDFVTIPEGDYKGVLYKINEAEIVEKDGKNYLKLDYDVRGLDNRDAAEFEHHISNAVLEALDWAIKKDEGNQIKRK